MKPIVKNMFSVDVEDFFHGRAFNDISRANWQKVQGRVKENSNTILNLLAKYNVKATFFFLGWVAQQYPDLARRIHMEGHEVASHGYWHNVNASYPGELYEDMVKSKETIEQIIGAPVYGYRFPCFVNSKLQTSFLDMLKKADYLYDSSLYPPYHPWYRWNSKTRMLHQACLRFYEIPLSSLNVQNCELPMGGGGYFRLFPAWVFLKGISYLNNRNIQAVMYIHPYDIDPKSPAPRRLTSKVRRKICVGNPLKKLQKIFQTYQFTRMIDAVRDYAIETHKAGDKT
ncbi:MAG: polysaccharide deacetylase family protein [Candidatus Omnitrophica bacterium]|nr:polysaccharide deacetylase family protein [Candidatus Omnitrophota bacterium]